MNKQQLPANCPLGEQYAKNIESGLDAFDKWMQEQGIKPSQLPADVWKLPKSCPIWEMGLSLAQAMGILASKRRKRCV